MANSEKSPVSTALAGFLKDHAGEYFTLAQLSAELGVTINAGHLTGAKSILGKDAIVRNDVEAPASKVVGEYAYIKTVEYSPKEDSNPSDGSKAVAELLRSHEGAYFTLAEMAETLGYEKVPSGWLSGAKSILGKDNISKQDREVPTMKTVGAYSYIA